MKEDTREIYSIPDCKEIVRIVLKEELNLGYNLLDFLADKVEKEFEHINWIRFQDANCPGCVSGPEECDIYYGRKEFDGTWKKIVEGEIQNCPARGGGGTFTFSKEEGFKKIDIANHKFNVVKPLEDN